MKSGISQNWLELATSILSGLAIATIIIYLVWQGLQKEEPPGFEIIPGASRQSGTMFQVPLRVRNTGDEAAQSVEISVKLKQSGKPDSESKTTIDWLPGKSERKAVAVFSENPDQGELSTEVEGYQAP